MQQYGGGREPRDASRLTDPTCDDVHSCQEPLTTNSPWFIPFQHSALWIIRINASRDIQGYGEEWPRCCKERGPGLLWGDREWYSPPGCGPASKGGSFSPSCSSFICKSTAAARPGCNCVVKKRKHEAKEDCFLLVDVFRVSASARERVEGEGRASVCFA